MNRTTALLRAAIIVSLSFVSICSVYAAEKTMTLEEIVSLKRVSAAYMSPNGDAIAYLLSVPRTLYKDDDGAAWKELHVVDLDGKSRAYVTGHVNVNSAAWSNDGQSIFFLSKRGDDKHSVLYEIPVNGGEANRRYAHKTGIKSIYPSPDGKSLAFIASDAPPEKKKELKKKGFQAMVYEESLPASGVWTLDLATDKAKRQSLPGSASAFSWAPDSSKYAVALAPTPLVDDSYTSRDISVVDASDGSVKNKLGSVGKLGRFEFSPDGSRVAYIGSVDINDPAPGRLFVVAAGGGQRRELLPDYPGHVQDFYWADNESVRYSGARGLWTEIALATRASTPKSAPADGPIVRSIDSYTGSKVTAVVADTTQHPTEVFVYEDGKELRRLTDSNPILNERKLAKQEAIRYTARDGVELDAILVTPLKKPARSRKPLVIFVHGGPEAHYSNGWMSNYSQPAQVLAAKGYAVVWPNYRGSTGRGVAFSKLGQNDYAEEEFNDIVDVKTHLVKRGIATKNHTGVSGGSYGGYASMWAATALSEHFAASVAFVGISNQVSKFGTGDIPYEMYNVHSRAWPWEDWMWMLKRSPVYHADKARTPLLIMHGDKDPRVHPSQSLEMYRHIKLRTKTPVRLVFYPGEGHGNRKTAGRYDYSMRFTRWMDHYLTGAGGTPPAYEIDHAARLKDNDKGNGTDAN